MKIYESYYQQKNAQIWTLGYKSFTIWHTYSEWGTQQSK